MSDDVTKLILGDTAVSAVEGSGPPRRRFFGRKKKERPPLTHCENCGAPLTGRYCGQCGQPAIDYRRSIGHVFVDVLNEFLNWDSKFFATIGFLIVKPWRLTNEFLAGHRVRYVHPLRLYLLASILFFFAATYGVKSVHIDTPKDLPPELKAKIDEDLKKEDLTPDQRARVQRALDITDTSPEAVTKIAKKIREKDAKRAAKGRPTASATPKSSPKTDAEAEKDAEAPKEIDSKPEPESKSDDNPMLQFGPDGPKNNLGRWLESRAKEKMGEHGTKMQLFVVTLISNLPYMMLCCIPLFALVLKILYVRKKIFYIDHLIYALHIHTFLYLAVMLIIGTTLGLNRLIPSFAWLPIALLWTTFAVQNFLSIRYVYKQGWFFSLFKFFVGGFAYLIVLCVALAATFFITLALPS